MAHENGAAKPQFVLPASVAEPSDVMRAARELEQVDDFLREAAIRNSGAASALPKTTKGLQALAESNGLNLLQADDRAKLDRLLEAIQKAAPVLHVSFAAEPSVSFVDEIVTRLRQSLHPYLLVQIGLQPSIAGGCVVRSENKLFDFSLRQYLQKHKDLLTNAIAAIDRADDAKEAAAAAAPVSAAAVTPPAAIPAAAKLAVPLASPSAVPQEAKA